MERTYSRWDQTVRWADSRGPWVLAGWIAALSGAAAANAQCPVEMAKLRAPQGAPHVFQSAEVSIAGDTAVIGAMTAGTGGVAYVFYRDQGGPSRWAQVACLELVNAAPQDGFGSSVAIEGDTIAVGAARGSGGIGAAYVFGRNVGGPDAWGLVKELTSSTPSPDSFFGQSVGISSDTLAVGAPHDETMGTTGSVSVFERNLGGPNNWGEAALLLQSDGHIGVGAFGADMAIEGDTIASGAYGAYNSGIEGGAVYVFERDAGGPGSWGEVQKLAPSDFMEYDFFGEGLSLSGDTLAISSLSEGGAVYLFGRNGTWTEQLKRALPGIGQSVALDGDTLVAQRQSDPGAAYVLRRDSGGPGTWGVQAEFVASDGYPGNGFGRDVALDGETFIVGARGDDHEQLSAAAAYLFAPTPLACPERYCTPGVTSNGCTPTISTRGIPSASASSGFELVARGVEGGQLGIFFYGISGRGAMPWGDPTNGCTSTLCVAAPLIRCATRSSGGALGGCSGTFTYDLTAQWASSPNQTPSVGLTIQAQLWFRDANNLCNGAPPFATTALSDAIEFVVGP